jgi:uncharacterized protein YmfQ (DUF2313 family)
MDALAYARQLKALLPPGVLWSTEAASALSKLLLGIADELARIDGRAADLLEEWDPRTADETLEDWERVLGITPGESDTEAARRLAITAKVIARGGSTPYYFMQLAVALGFVVGLATFTSDPHIWKLEVNLATSTSPFALRTQAFRTGASRCGDRLRSWTIPELEDLINRLKPAHTKARFIYSS